MSHLGEFSDRLGQPRLLIKSVVDPTLLSEGVESKCPLIQFLLLVSQHFVVVVQLVSHIRVIKLLVAGLPLQEVLELRLRAIWTDIPGVLVVVSVGHVSMLRLTDDSLLIGSSFQRAVSKRAHRVLEQRFSPNLI